MFDFLRKLSYDTKKGKGGRRDMTVMGSYKISSTLLKKLTVKRIIAPSGESINGVSSNELDAVIYFSTIADAAGNIERFRISFLASILGCTTRAAFNLVHGLAAKGIIQVQDTRWAGVKDIRLLDNDFSCVTDYKTASYINTNRSFFDPSQYFSSFCSLSLFAKRTLLVLLDSYHTDLGCRISVDNIASRLQIKNRRLVIRYLAQLETLLGDGFYSITPDLIRRYRYGTANIHKHNRFLVPNTGIWDEQDSYFKRHMRIFMHDHGLIGFTDAPDMAGEINRTLNQVYSVLYVYLRAGCDAAACLGIIQQTVLDYRQIDLRLIRKRLQDTFGKVKAA